MALRQTVDTSESDERSWSPAVVRGHEATYTSPIKQATADSAPSPIQLHLDVVPDGAINGTQSFLPLERREHRNILAHWEGIVTAVEKDVFFAAARDLKGNENLPSSELEMDLARVEASERELVREGAIFYLTVGVRYPKGEGPQDFAQLVFRRLPRWSKDDIRRTEAAADEFWEKQQAKRRILTEQS